jgi:hypothetical protein
VKIFFHRQADAKLSEDGLFVSKLSPTTGGQNNSFSRFDNSLNAQNTGELSKGISTKIDFRPIIDFKLLLCQGNNTYNFFYQTVCKEPANKNHQILYINTWFF